MGIRVRDTRPRAKAARHESSLFPVGVRVISAGPASHSDRGRATNESIANIARAAAAPQSK
jgi:hypothetical protein